MKNSLKTLLVYTFAIVILSVSSCKKADPCTSISGETTTNIAATSATLRWINTNASPYTVQYRLTGSNTWLAAASTTDSLSLTGLSLNSGYEWQVKSTCSSFSALATFSTTGCPAGYEGPNCQTAMNTKFAGTYSITDTAIINGAPQVFLYTMPIAISSDPGHIVIYNFGGFGSNVVVTATVNGNSFSVPSYTLQGFNITNVQGTINGNLLAFTYVSTDTSTSNVSIDHAFGSK